MYNTCIPTYLRAYVPIVWFVAMYSSLNYLRRSSNLLTHLLTYEHTYVITYVPTCLHTFVPTYLYYLCMTNVPTYLNYLCAYLFTYFHSYLSYLLWCGFYFWARAIFSSVDSKKNSAQKTNSTETCTVAFFWVWQQKKRWCEYYMKTSTGTILWLFFWAFHAKDSHERLQRHLAKKKVAQKTTETSVSTDDR